MRGTKTSASGCPTSGVLCERVPQRLTAQRWSKVRASDYGVRNVKDQMRRGIQKMRSRYMRRRSRFVIDLSCSCGTKIKMCVLLGVPIHPCEEAPDVSEPPQGLNPRVSAIAGHLRAIEKELGAISQGTGRRAAA